METKFNLISGTWRKSSYSNQTGGQCVEVAVTKTNKIAIRDTQHQKLGFLDFGSREWIAFICEQRDSD